MRNPKRISRISKLIGEIWRKNPNLRLCQLIENCARLKKHKLTDEPYRESMYYLEDEELEQRLKEVYLNIKPLTSAQLKKLKKVLEKRLRDPYLTKDTK